MVLDASKANTYKFQTNTQRLIRIISAKCFWMRPKPNLWINAEKVMLSFYSLQITKMVLDVSKTNP